MPPTYRYITVSDHEVPCMFSTYIKYQEGHGGHDIMMSSTLRTQF